MGESQRDSILPSVLSRFEIEGPRVIEAIAVGERNDSWIVEDAGGRRYVLRRYRRNRNPARVRFQLAFQRHLLDEGFPASEIVPARGGELFLADEGPWAVFPLVEGEPPRRGKPEDVAEAGRRLAELHEIGAGFTEVEIPMDFDPRIRDWWLGPERLFEGLPALFGDADVSVEMEFLLGWSERLSSALPAGAEDGLPVGWVHSDYHPGNMVFEGGTLKALFDFDVVNRGPLATDLGVPVLTFSPDGAQGLRIDRDTAEVFLRAYNELRPLTPEEKAALPAMFSVTFAPLAAYYDVIARDGEDVLAAFRRHVATMRAMDRQVGVIQEAVAAL